MDRPPEASRARDFAALSLAGPLLGLVWSLVVWAFLRDRLSDLPAALFPMAPCSILGMALLASAFHAAHRASGGRLVRAWAWGVLVFVGGMAGAILAGYAFGFDPLFEHWLMPSPLPVPDFARQEIKLLGRMSPITAGIFLLSVPIPVLLPKRRRAAAALACAVCAAVFVFLLGFITGTPLIHGRGLSPAAFLSALSFAFLAAGTLAVAGSEMRALDFFLPHSGTGGLRAARGPLLAFLGAVLLVACAAIAFLRAQRGMVYRAAQAEVSAIADLKSQQIERWMAERRADAESLARSPMIQSNLAPSAAPDPRLAAWLDSLRSKGGYAAVAIHDAQGALRCRVPREAAVPGPSGGSSGALEEGLFLEDLHTDAEFSGRIHMCLRAPVRNAEGTRILGFVSLSIDPESYLFPMLGLWPGPSRTAETLIVRREGGQVVNLSGMRHLRNGELSFRRELRGDSRLPAVQAVLGRRGEVEGVDYRGMPVLASLRAISGTPWLLVAKVDMEEVFGPLRFWGWVTGFLALNAIGMAALGIGLQRRRLDAQHLERQLAWERVAQAMALRFHHLMREANDIILLADGEHRLLETNLRAAERYGRPVEELAGLRLEDLAAPDSLEASAEGLRRAHAEGSARFELWHRDARERRFPVQVSAREADLQGTPYLILILQDITERRAQEAEIRRLTSLYAALSQVNQTIVRAASRPELFREVCRVVVEFGHFEHAWIAGCQEDAPLVRILAECGRGPGALARHLPRTGEAALRAGPSGMAIREERTVIIRDPANDPGLRPFRQAFLEMDIASIGAFPVRRGGRVWGAIVVASGEQDAFRAKEIALLEEAAMDLSFAMDHLDEVARRTAAEQDLCIQAEHLRLAVASAQLGIWELDFQHGRGHLDPRMGEIAGIKEVGEVPLALWRERLHPDERRRVLETVHTASRNGAPFSLTCRIQRPDGQVRVLRSDGIFLKDSLGRAMHGVGMSRDITEELSQEEERHRLQAQLHQSQKLESLGSLAGGVAHDMNNVLGAILSRASAQREGMDGADPVAKSMDVIISACMRGRGVLKSLLCFARRELEEARAVDLNGLVRELVELLAYTTLQRVQFETELQEPLAPIHGDPGALSNALMNLCVNAADAMPKGGVITLKTRVLPGDQVEVSVRDTGEGMTPEVKENALEPFFTTKPLGKGTGLGLSMVFGTVQAHGGLMVIESAPGAGTEVRLRFPATEAPPENRVPAASREPDPNVPSEKLRILLVDDDELIRESVGHMLEKLGHRVELAGNGLQALGLLEGGLEIDRVILDMNMPGMDGAEALPRILALRPGVPVLIATGYSDHDIAPLLKQHPLVSSLRKPFSLREIRRKLAEIQELLARASPAEASPQRAQGTAPELPPPA